MVFAGTISGLVASGLVDKWTDYEVLDVFGDQYAMQLFGVVFGYLSVARLNISYNRRAPPARCPPARLGRGETDEVGSGRRPRRTTVWWRAGTGRGSPT